MLSYALLGHRRALNPVVHAEPISCASCLGGQRQLAVELGRVTSSQALGSLVAAGWHLVLSVLHFLGHWSLALSGFIAAVAAAVALWFNALPFCDVYNVKVERDGDSVHLI